jgi:hypothetical protein
MGFQMARTARLARACNLEAPPMGSGATSTPLALVETWMYPPCAWHRCSILLLALPPKSHPCGGPTLPPMLRRVLRPIAASRAVARMRMDGANTNL